MAIGFGIVGCGMIANFHARAVADIRGASVVACFDTFPAAADRLAQSLGCRAYHDLHAMLDDPRVEVVTICTPSGAHLEPAVAAASAGKHVIVEKPLEITLQRCDRIIDACAKAGVVLSTIFPSRFHEASQLLKKAVDTGPLRSADGRRCVREVVSHAAVLRQRGLARHLEARRRRGADEPGHSQRRSAELVDGPRPGPVRSVRHAGS